MVTLDQKWLKEHSLKVNQIKGVIILSDTTFNNHFIKKEYGIEITQALLDHYAPVYYARDDNPYYIDYGRS